MHTEPLLSSPPALVFLGITVGLSAYLRQMAEDRDLLIEKIEDGRLKKFPPCEHHTNKKLEHLRSSRRKLRMVAPIIIWLTIAVAARITALSYWRLVAPDEQFPIDHTLRVVDVLIMTAFSLLFIGLWFMHWSSQQKDDQIRELTTQWCSWKLRRTQEKVANAPPIVSPAKDPVVPA
jgi:hypothetical protein